MIVKVYGRNCITSKRISHANQKDLNEGIDDVLNDAAAQEIQSIINDCGEIDLEEYYTDLISKM